MKLLKCDIGLIVEQKFNFFATDIFVEYAELLMKLACRELSTLDIKKVPRNFQILFGNQPC